MDILKHWGLIEADFLRFYNIEKPLDVEYNRFLRLLRALPPADSSFLSVLSAEQITVDSETGQMYKTEDYNKDSRQAKRMLQKQHKRNKPRQTMSLDDLIGSDGGFTG